MEPDGRWLTLALHDVAPATWDRCQRVLDAVREVAEVPVTLLVVPAYHGECSARPAFEARLGERLAAGDELALHGYFHCDPQAPCGVGDWLRRRIYTLEGEFGTLCEREAGERIHLGQRWFAANRWPLYGFVAPAWLLSDGTWTALRANRQFLYTSTLSRLHLLPAVASVAAPCLTWSTRAAWRRLGSLAWNGTLVHAVQSSPVVRLGLHPDDAGDRAIRRSWQHCLARLLEDRRAVTKGEFAQAWAGSLSDAAPAVRNSPAPPAALEAR